MPDVFFIFMLVVVVLAVVFFVIACAMTSELVKSETLCKTKDTEIQQLKQSVTMLETRVNEMTSQRNMVSKRYDETEEFLMAFVLETLKRLNDNQPVEIDWAPHQNNRKVKQIMSD